MNCALSPDRSPSRQEPPTHYSPSFRKTCLPLHLWYSLSQLSSWPSRRERRKRFAAVFFLLILLQLVAMLGACNGGSSSGPPPPPVVGTPAGTYTLTLTGTSGIAQRTMQFTLVVQ